MNMNQEEQMMWGSHLAPLMACLAVTNDSVLELGAGYFSTPVLTVYCEAAGRPFISLEKDREWRAKVKLADIDYDYDLDYAYFSNQYGPYSVVFIDDSPGGQNRADHFAQFIGQSDYVVVHDYHRENEEAIRPLLTECSYIVCDRFQPPTLVASKTKRIPECLAALSSLGLTSLP